MGLTSLVGDKGSALDTLNHAHFTGPGEPESFKRPAATALNVG